MFNASLQLEQSKFMSSGHESRQLFFICRITLQYTYILCPKDMTLLQCARDTYVTYIKLEGISPHRIKRFVTSAEAVTVVKGYCML